MKDFPLKLYLVISLLNNLGHNSWRYFKLDVFLGKLQGSVCQDQVCNVVNAVAVQLAEDDHLIQPVQELGPEVCLPIITRAFQIFVTTFPNKNTDKPKA